LFATACQIGQNYYSASGPQPPEGKLTQETVYTDLEKAQIPFETVSVEPAFVKITMAYAYQSDTTPETSFEADVITISRVMCQYDPGYNLEITYNDAWEFHLDWHFVRAFCTGVGGKIAENELTTYGNYINPQGKLVTLTPGK
jgi:hypothetical protein